MDHPPRPPALDNSTRIPQAGPRSTPRPTTRGISLPRTLLGTRPAGWLLFPAAVTALLVIGYVLMRLYGRFVTPIPYDTKALFHITTEGGVVSWWNSALLLGIAALALLLAALSGPGRPASGRVGRASWLMAGAAAGYLSLDESVQLHERLGGPAGRLLGGDGEPLFTFAWVLPGAALASIGCVLVVRWARRLPFDLRTGLFAAMATYVTGALGLEALNGQLKRQHADLARQLGTLVEESMEMAGCLIALATFAAALVLVRDSSGRLVLGLRPDLADPRAAVRAAARPRGTERPRMLDSAAVTGVSANDLANDLATADNPRIPEEAPEALEVPGAMGAMGAMGALGALGAAVKPEDPEEAALRPDPRDEMR